MDIQKQSASRGPSSKRWGLPKKILVLFVMAIFAVQVQMLGFPEIPTLQTSFGIVPDVIGDNSLPNASSHSSIVGLPISGESEVGNRQSSGNSDDAGKATDTEFRALWPQIQDALCPENKPNVALGARLFQLAAKELNITNSRQPWMSDFFIKVFMPGGRKECRTILKAGMQVCYVDIWKCANREIRGYLQALMGKETAPNAKMTQCWFTVVRDPVERFLSGYNEIERRLLWEGFENVARGYPFRKKRIPSEERFVQFVADILQRTGRGHGHTVFRHVYSMSGVLLRNDAPPPAYLPTIRNLTLALPLFLKRECDGFGDLDGDPALMDAMPREGELQRDRLSGNDPLGTYAASRSAWMRQGPASRALCLIVAMDYACWRNLEGVPPLCKDVFVGDDLVYLARNSTQHI